MYFNQYPHISIQVEKKNKNNKSMKTKVKRKRKIKKIRKTKKIKRRKRMHKMITSFHMKSKEIWISVDQFKDSLKDHKVYRYK